LPSNIEDVKIVGEIMSEYKDKYYFTVLLGFSLVYLLYPISQYHHRHLF